MMVQRRNATGLPLDALAQSLTYVLPRYRQPLYVGLPRSMCSILPHRFECPHGLFRPGHAFETAILLYSESGSNGKGTYLEMLHNLAGVERVATLSPSDFESRFLPSSLTGSFAVLSDESDVDGYLEKAKIFKSWLSHDWVPFERKNRDLVKPKGRGLCVFCVNELPSFKDKNRVHV